MVGSPSYGRHVPRRKELKLDMSRPGKLLGGSSVCAEYSSYRTSVSHLCMPCSYVHSEMCYKAVRLRIGWVWRSLRKGKGRVEDELGIF